MKKHKFKLEAVLKLRESREKKIKVELGEIVSEMQRVKDRIVEIENDVEIFYNSQEECVTSPTSGHMMKFYPEAVRGLKVDKLANENLLRALEKRYDRKVHELKTAMGETKVMANMKEKDFQAFKKDAEKKSHSAIEELILMRMKERAS